MATGLITWACLLLAASAPASDDVIHMNQRNFQIPIKIRPESQGSIGELQLYVSTDLGLTWQMCGRAHPTKQAFEFVARADGPHWFTMCIKDRSGVLDPKDPSLAPPEARQKILIDTARPVVRIVSAERAGDRLAVQWDIQEQHPEMTSLRLEYRPDAGASWTPLAIEPALKGKQEFTVPPGDLTVRLQIRDLAGNEGGAEKVVLGAAAPPPHALAAGETNSQVQLVSGGRPPVAGGTEGPASPPPSPVPSSPEPARGSPAVAAAPASTPAPSPGPGPSSVATGGAPMPPRMGQLPRCQIVNKKQVKLDFEVAKFGPSGLGGVDVYLTTDEGLTWEKSAGDPGVSLPVPGEARGAGPVHGSVTVALPRDGVIYGFYLVVKNRAGLGKLPPNPGDAPQIRIELDTTLPVAELYAPQPEPGSQNGLVLSWKAEDRNLAANPISLEWASNRDGPWDFIGDPQLPNTGKYVWKVPEKVPVKAYLRLSVRDTAGNVAVAQTPEPVLIDLIQPEVGSVKMSAP